MKYEPQKHHRRSIRLKGYNYTQSGMYFITIVTLHGDCLFGEIVNGEMQLSAMGQIADENWRAIPTHFPEVELGAYVIMPNHAHGIISITGGRGVGPTPHNVDGSMNTGGGTPPLRKPTLGQVVAYFKYQSTKAMNTLSNTGTITKFWQRNYYEHIIRNEADHHRIHLYIESNIDNWVH